jgi:hypothetical protein
LINLAVTLAVFSDTFLQNLHHSGQDDLAEYFAGDTKKVDAPPILAI